MCSESRARPKKESNVTKVIVRLTSSISKKEEDRRRLDLTCIKLKIIMQGWSKEKNVSTKRRQKQAKINKKVLCNLETK